MASIAKITILLADEDALRRDGLAAVLSGASEFQVVASVADGEAAIAEARARRPDVAVVDLTLPKVHGIEVIRRIRSEMLGTKVVIMAGTDEDEIIREVVRAGGDGYLLKNGPARHLVDAISYVRDGGQYFSPQLRRDGRDRHLLEEPRRPAAIPFEPAAQPSSASSDSSDAGEEYEGRSDRSGKARRAKRAVRREPTSLKDRIREVGPTPDLDDRDYEIMSMMAEGIRPILDRLDEIDFRVAQMETGDIPLPESPRRWLTSQLAESMGGRSRGYSGSGTDIARNLESMEAYLPDMIEEAVSSRFEQMSGKLQQEIEETHVKTLETFVKTIQTKLVRRVAVLEQDMAKQAEAMDQLRESSARTEDNLSRLITGVDRLAQELPRRLAQRREAESDGAEPEFEPEVLPPPRPKSNSGSSANARKIAKIAWVSLLGAALLGLVGWGAMKIASKAFTHSQDAATSQGTTPGAKPVKPPAAADNKTKIAAAQEAADRKDYQMAEEIYRQIVKDQPNNAEALKGLASVLYRQDKIDDAAAVLDKIPKE